MTTVQIIQIGKDIAKILKARFPNLTVEETGDIVGDIVTMIDEVLE